MLADKIEDKELRRKVIDLLENPTFELEGQHYNGLPLDISPGSLSRHHSYKGGYLEHVVSTTNIALTMCNSIEKIYHGKVNRDLVIAGVLLHDLFKTVTYSRDNDGNYNSTSLSDQLDHLTIAASELIRKDFPLSLIHIVSAHHGEYGPIRPRTIEALVCHLADLTDSRLNGEVLNAATYLSRRATGSELSRLTSKEAFEIVHSKSIEGWEGVSKTVEKIDRKRKSHKT
jgi:putative nucleotidyltransferase with HDIG domain